MKNTLIELPSGDWILPSSILSVVLRFSGLEEGAKSQAFVHVVYRTAEPCVPCQTVFDSTIKIPVVTAEDGWTMIRKIAMDMGITVQAPVKPPQPSRAMQRFYDFQDANQFSLEILEREQLPRTSDGRFYCHFTRHPRVLESDQTQSCPSGNGMSPEAAIKDYARAIAGKKISRPGTGASVFIQVPNFFE